MEINTPLSPGEFFDKFTILVNKISNCKKSNNVMWAMIGLVDLASSAKDAGIDWESISTALLELVNVNQELWKLELDVRRRNPKDLEGIANDSTNIRIINATRWNIKRIIDETLQGTLEVKEL